MVTFIETDDNAELVKRIPEELPILPLRNTVAFPFSALPLVVGIPRSVKLVKDAREGNRLIGLLTAKDPSIEEPGPGQIYEIGTVAKVYHMVKAPNDTLQVVVQGLERFRVEHWLGTEPYLRARITLIPDVVDSGVELDALQRALRDLTREVISLSPNLSEEVSNFLNQVEDPRYLAYLVAANARLEISKAQEILEKESIKDKLRALISHLSHEKEVLTLGQKIQTEAREEMDKAHREYYLRQQLKAIQKELGETDETQSAAVEYTKKIEDANLPEEAKKEALRELKRLRSMSPQSAEYAVIKTYLDWLVELPWNELSEDQLEIHHARAVLDEDHYDLQDVKDRIIEYLAVRKLVQERGVKTEPGEEATASEAMGAILCFVGPPGVGKTSLGQSIARALGRKFTRMSLGGMRDEAEIRGHRRTYIGAMPGRIIQAIKRAGTRNPVFMLDEVDKIGSDWRGDPSSALLEVLDPAQNHTFRDHYLDVDFDLSDVIFITTANQLETIPPPLRDRMEIIQLDGYTEHEKVRIAQGHLVPRQLKANALREDEITFNEEALRKIIQDYTREAGVRNLERQIGAVCRKSVVKISANELTSVEVTPEMVREYLKKEKFESESSENIEIPGIATGLAVTAVGGDILFVEATSMKGKGVLTLTGQLGDVMRESAQIAHSFVRSKASQLGIEPGLFEKMDVHLHVPAGAIPKDGPSAGVAMVMAIASLFCGRPVRSEVGMTGEVTLRGRVMPVGGIKMKVLAAHRAGLTMVILPKRNERDLEDLPEDVRKAMTFVPVERIDEALKMGLLSDETLTEMPEVSEWLKSIGATKGGSLN
ncbi:MAG: endopeptidase La [Deltaproteobacteria bacterium]|nr:MAG: endopeptidase La [Deltaproteobacteria bacterium]